MLSYPTGFQLATAISADLKMKRPLHHLLPYNYRMALAAGSERLGKYRTLDLRFGDTRQVLFVL
jgi:hypothetical protein